MQKLKHVGMFGCACGQKGDDWYDDAFKVAKTLSSRGYDVVNGGGPGIMEASTLGAMEGGGESTVVYYKPELAENFTGEKPQEGVTRSYEEEDYMMRTKKLIELSDIYVVFYGGTGTLSEFGMVWGLARLYFGHHKPVILYGEFWHEILDVLMKNLEIRSEAREVITIVNSDEAVLSKIDYFDRIIDENDKLHKRYSCVGSECAFIL